MLLASAATSDPNASVTSATTSIRSLPNMSPSRPRIGVKIEALSRKAVSTQATAVAEVCRSRWISGSAGATRDCRRAYVAPLTARTPNVRP